MNRHIKPDDKDVMAMLKELNHFMPLKYDAQLRDEHWVVTISGMTTEELIDWASGIIAGAYV